MPDSSALALRPQMDPKTNSESRPLNGSLNGTKNGTEDHNIVSKLSDPDSNVPSPSRGIAITGLEDEIVVSARVHGNEESSSSRIVPDKDDVAMVDALDEPSASPHPKRKRNLTYSNLAESNIENADTVVERTLPLVNIEQKPVRLPVAKYVMVGYWRDSNVPDAENKHVVVGFIDALGRLRTRIQPYNRCGDLLAADYPPPPGPGGSLMTFERVVFDDHLVGLDHVQVKEYVRIMAEAQEDPAIDLATHREAAVQEAIRRVKDNPLYDNPTVQRAIAYGADAPAHVVPTNRLDSKRVIEPDNKRRRVSSGFTSVNQSHAANNGQRLPPNGIAPIQYNVLDPLDGTSPTRILVGTWTKSGEVDEKDRHAVYGILSQNGRFRVKLVRETRDGRFVEGNFPRGAGGPWIQWEEVNFDSHLKDLNGTEIREYCRVRQYQLDRGESAGERMANEEQAVKEAKLRASLPTMKITNNANPHPIAAAAAREFAEADDLLDQLEDAAGLESQEIHSTRRALPSAAAHAARYARDEAKHRSARRGPRGDALERTAALAQQEIVRIEAAQGRADRAADQRERVAAASAVARAAAADRTAASTASSPELTNGVNGKVPPHETADLQRLNEVWARQENLRMKATAEDAKMHCGIKYERKTTGPFMGKLMSQGTIINIGDEDYVEYRVLTKPSFF
ncbi:hypothetical protein S40288_07054 [Stachybotrys chartarum IBT 40288]|nr:hypothetical protein S40288_07054 [Stachybotrys chartarum IBT 40288]